MNRRRRGRERKRKLQREESHGKNQDGGGGKTGTHTLIPGSRVNPCKQKLQKDGKEKNKGGMEAEIEE